MARRKKVTKPIREVAERSTRALASAIRQSRRKATLRSLKQHRPIAIKGTVFPTKHDFIRAVDKRVALQVGRKRRPAVKLVRKEKRLIRKNRVRSILSLVSPFDCERKRAIARREYMGMKAAGKGAKTGKPHQNKFTVRC